MIKETLHNRNVIIEYVPVGRYVRVSAMDEKTLTEITIQGPSTADEKTLKSNALKRLEYVLRKKGLIA